MRRASAARDRYAHANASLCVRHRCGGQTAISAACRQPAAIVRIVGMATDVTVGASGGATMSRALPAAATRPALFPSAHCMPAARHHTAMTTTNTMRVRRRQRTDEDRATHMQRHDDHQLHASARAVLQRDGTADDSGACRPHGSGPAVHGQREHGHRQDSEQAARHRADVRRGRPQGVEDPTAGGHPPILTPQASQR